MEVLKRLSKSTAAKVAVAFDKITPTSHRTSSVAGPSRSTAQAQHVDNDDDITHDQSVDRVDSTEFIVVEDSTDTESNGDDSDDDDDESSVDGVEAISASDEQDDVAGKDAQDKADGHSSNNSNDETHTYPEPSANLGSDNIEGSGVGQIQRQTGEVLTQSEKNRVDNTPALVPVEEVVVVKWTLTPSAQSDFPDMRAWLVRNSTTPVRFKVWTDNQFLKEIRDVHPDACRTSIVSLLNDTTRPTSFGYGAQLMDLALTIKTSGGKDRPKWLWRAVHDEMPHGGIKARGHGRVINDTVFFQRRLRSHLVPQSKRSSPFLTTTTQKQHAVEWAAKFESANKTGIKIIRVTTTGVKWNHSKSKLWDLKYLMGRFGMNPSHHNRFEYLVEDVIPSQHITTYQWDDVKDAWDPNRSIRERFMVKATQNESMKRKREEDFAGRVGMPKEKKQRKQSAQRTTQFNATIYEKA